MFLSTSRIHHTLETKRVSYADTSSSSTENAQTCERREIIILSGNVLNINYIASFVDYSILSGCLESATRMAKQCERLYSLSPMKIIRHHKKFVCLLTRLQEGEREMRVAARRTQKRWWWWEEKSHFFRGRPKMGTDWRRKLISSLFVIICRSGKTFLQFSGRCSEKCKWISADLTQNYNS